MGMHHYIISCVIVSLTLFTLSASVRNDDFADIRGPYCENIGCCNDRQDSCSVPILGTLCYCDDFCNLTRVDDCCPDYWSFCKHIVIPTPPPTPEPVTSCPYGRRALLWKQEVKENCNKCVCEQVGENQLELLCEQNMCLTDSNIINTINRDPEEYGWTAANYSEFWGRTLDEGVRFRLGTLPPQQFVLHMNPIKRSYDPYALPKYFDAREAWPGLVTGIQDQGWCGASWAISTAAVASDRYGIVSRGKEAVQLSAQHLVSCDIQGQQSCNGGHLDRAWNFARAYGLVDEECFPYVARNERCPIKRRGTLQEAGCNPKYSERKVRYTVAPAYRLGNETDIMFEITRSGPVQATMKVYQDFFTYNGGIYKHSNLGVNNIQGYHSVRIVGWGEDYTGYGGPQKYWKVANSWGTNWGEEGYFRIARGINECEIESFVVASWPHISRKILLGNDVNEI